MCGIVGLINCGDKEILITAGDVIKHRGPDDKGTVWFDQNNSGLGHRRLSIIDLSEMGHQPMSEKNGRYWIVFNGEIYNYLSVKEELKKKGHQFYSNSDTEVVLRSFIEWKENCLNKFNGMFAFAIYDVVEKSLFLARDRVGIKPLYYIHINNSFMFASEIKSILSTKLFKIEPDYLALHTPVHFQVSPYTGFKNIYKLSPGSYLTYKNDKLDIHKYWEIHPEEEDNKQFSEYEKELENILNDSVKLQMISDVPIGLLLSGGLDSSIIAALMTKNTSSDINSFTIKFDESDLKKQGNVDDSYYAKKVARLFHLNHKEIIIKPDVIDLLPKIVWHLDEPLSDPSAINTYLISKAAKEAGISVLLNGMGGDEIFGGYRAYMACLFAEYYNKVPSFIDHFVKTILYHTPQASKTRNYKLIRWAKEFLSYADLPQDERYMSSGNVALMSNNFNDFYADDSYNYYDSAYVKKQKKYFSKSNCSYLTKMCLNDTLIYMPDHNLTYSDKASMAAGVEGRPPLTDHRIVEFMFKLAPKYRIHGNVQKYLLKKVSRKYLPKEIVYRPKAPFSAPMRSWLRGSLKEMTYDLLSEENIKKRGLYNPEYVSELLKNNYSGLQDNSQVIFRLLNMEIWFRTFFN